MTCMPAAGTHSWIHLRDRPYATRHRPKVGPLRSPNHDQMYNIIGEDNLKDVGIAMYTTR